MSNKRFWLIPYLAGAFLIGLGAFGLLFGGLNDAAVLRGVFGALFIGLAYGIYWDQKKKGDGK